MKQEIKKRIDRINFGEVPEGYKKTKVGIMPKEWKDICWGNFIEEKINFTSDIEKYPLYSLIIENGVIPKSERYERSHLVKKNEDTYKVVQKDDFVYNPMNIRFGAVAIHKENIDDAVSGYYDVFEINTNANKVYLDNLLKSKMMLNYFDTIATGSLVEKRRVHFSQLVSFKLPLPSLPEQNKIAEILSTWDKAIELKEKYIKNLGYQKKGLMLNLLTGKIRPSGFSGKWQKVLSKYIFENISDKKHDGKLEVLSVTQENGVVKRTDVGIDIKYNKESLNTYKKVIPGQFIISLRSFQGGIEFSEYEGLVSPAYTILSNSKPICEYYYKYYFKTQTFISKLNSLIYGIRDGKQIGYSDFSTLKIDYPPIEEQKAIANILSLADLETLKLQKKGLMQVLLTGKVRVAI